ncbi:MAG TPA: alpha/beta fold hydrolase [Chloroflexota bacterium]
MRLLNSGGSWWLAAVLALLVGCAAPGAVASMEGLVDVGGQRLFVSCQGSGTPSVVLEADLRRASDDWSSVQSDLAPFSRVCSYDRSGLGRSQTTSAPAQAEQAVDDLRVLLAATGTRPPHVLVGNGFGGVLMRLYASRYPRDVAALVVLDSDDERLAARFQELTPRENRESYRRWLREDPDGQAVAATFGALRTAGPLPDVPLVVFAHGRPPVDPAEVEVYQDLALTVANGRLVRAEDSTAREIPRLQPGLVVETISALVRDTRTQAGGPPALLLVGAGLAACTVLLVMLQRWTRPRRYT